jgi:class 3 adenylate cyclase
MKYLNSWFQVNESDNSEENPIRSERLLTQAQRSFQDEPEVPSVDLPALLFTDVERSAEMWSFDATEMMAQLKDHHKLVEKLSEMNGGWIVKTIGDAFMIYFEPSSDSLERAIKCATEIILQEPKYKLRIGICQGPMQEDTYRIQKVNLRDFYGNAVNVASRMESRVAGQSDTIAFSSTRGLSQESLDRISNRFGEVMEVNLSKYDLKGAKINSAFRIKVK